MAKNKRRISAAQRDKSVLETAKILKSKGLISKQANLHSGRFVSRGVLKKVKELQHVAALDYVGIKANKDVIKAAKERGYMVANNRVIGPKSTSFRNRMQKGELTGIKPVKGGFMEEVVLPHTVMDMMSLMEQLENGIDTLKMPNEQFAFKFFGNESYRAFRDTEDLLQYLRHYKSIFTPSGSLKNEDLQEEFQNLTIMRLHVADIGLTIRSPDTRRKQKKEARARGEGRAYKGRSLAEKLEAMHPQRAARIRKKMAERSAEKRAKLAADPKKHKEYKEKAKERAKRSYENRKPKQ
jgi:hypothetical protein